MTKRLSPIGGVRAQIDDLFAAADPPLTAILEDVGRLSVRLLMSRRRGRGGGVSVAGLAMSAGTRTVRPDGDSGRHRKATGQTSVLTRPTSNRHTPSATITIGTRVRRAFPPVLGRHPRCPRRCEVRARFATTRAAAPHPALVLLHVRPPAAQVVATRSLSTSSTKKAVPLSTTVHSRLPPYPTKNGIVDVVDGAAQTVRPTPPCYAKADSNRPSSVARTDRAQPTHRKNRWWAAMPSVARHQP